MTKEKSKNLTYFNPTPGELSIMAGGLPKEVPILTDELIMKFKNAGVNLIQEDFREDSPQLFLSNGELNKEHPLIQTLQLADRKGVNIMIRMWIPRPHIGDGTQASFIGWRQRWQSIAKAARLYSSTGGYMLVDEPGSREFEQLALCKEGIVEVDDKHIIYINLFPETKNPLLSLGVYPSEDHPANPPIGENSLDVTDYNQYLYKFQQIVKPSVWSYDYYPFILKDGKYIMLDGFFVNLDRMSSQSAITNTPFWTYCLSMEFIDGNGNLHPAPTVSTLKIQAFCSLAFGAQGIVYWAFIQRQNTNTEKYISAPLFENGEINSSVYDVVRDVNNEVKKYQKVFLNCDFWGASSTADGVKGLTQFFLPFGPISDLINSKSTKILISHLKNYGHDYIVIINFDVDWDAYVEIKFSKNMINIKENVDAINEETMSNANLKPEKVNTIMEYNGLINPGDWIIFRTS